MSPHTRFIPLVVGALLLTAACGSPDDDAQLPTSGTMPSAGPPAASFAPSYGLPAPTYGYPTNGYPTVYPTYPTYAPYPTATTTPTQAPLTKSPTPTPAHAPRCSGKPTGAEIIALVKGAPGIPDKTLQVQAGPYCSDTWAFATLKLAGAGTDQQEPLNVVSIGQGTALTLVAAGSDVCNPQVQASAPAAIRVLACGF